MKMPATVSGMCRTLLSNAPSAPHNPRDTRKTTAQIAATFAAPRIWTPSKARSGAFGQARAQARDFAGQRIEARDQIFMLLVDL